MADQNNTIETKVVLDATQAKQEIIKLSVAASDTTKSLEERVEAKNKQVKLQNALAEQTIKQLEEQIDELKKLEGTEKEVLKLEEKLNKQRIAATKVTENGIKQQNKLNEKLVDSKDAMKQLDNATGGVVGGFKAIISNPIGAVLAGIAAVFATLRAAVNRSGKASEAFSKIGAKLSGIMNGFLAVLEPLVVFLGEKLLKAITEPKKAFKELGDFIKDNLTKRIEAFMVLGEAFSLLLSGDFKKAAKKGADALIQFNTGVEDGTEKLSKFAKESAETFDKAADASERLANSEKRLLANRQALEKQQLIFLNLAEKQRQIRDDTSKSFDERIKANNELGKILEKQTEVELALANQTLKIARDKVAAEGQTIEALENLGDAQLKILEIEERIVGQRSEQLTELNALRDDQAARNEEDAKKLADSAKKEKELALEKQSFLADIDEAEIAAKKEKGDKTLEIELDIIERRKQIELEGVSATQEELAALNLQFDNEKLAREREFEGEKLEQELELLEERRAIELEELNGSEEQKNAIIAKFEAEKRALKIETANEEKAVAEATAKAELELTKKKAKVKVDVEKQITDQIISSAGEAFGIQQELAVAEMIMKAPSAIAGSFQKAAETYPAPLSLAIGAAGAAATVIPIVKGLSDIKKARFPGKKKSGGSSGGGSVSTSVSTPSVATSSVTDLAANNAARLGTDPNLGQNASATAANNVTGSAPSEVVFSESKYSEFQQQVDFKEEKSSV